MTKALQDSSIGAWAVQRMPCLGAACTTLFAPTRAPEGAYLDLLPGLTAVTLALLTVSGLVLAVYYNPWHAFASIGFIRRGVHQGWLVQAYHATGTSMIFGLIYLTLLRAMLTRAYRAPGELVWLLGGKLYIILLLLGWLGFTLTGSLAGHVSLVVATSAAQALTSAPGAVARWIFGGPAGPGTLMRLEVLHVVLGGGAIIVLGLYGLARRAVRPPVEAGRGVAFFPYYAAQYGVALAVFGLIFTLFACFAPHAGQPALSAVPAAALASPAYVALPWYLAPLGAVADAVPGLGGGIIAVVAALAVLLALPWLDRSNGGRKGWLYGALIWLLALDVVGLGLARPGWLADLLVFWFFFHFLVLTPVVTAMEAP